MRLPVDAALAGVFRAKLGMGAFDTMVLATPNGQVVYAAGRRAAEMQAMSVSAILPVPAGKEHVDLTGLADTIFEERVRIAGVEYRMFAQPCCRSDALDAPVGPAPATGFMVIGLADTEAMRVASLAISPVLVLAGVALVMAALVGWPFLKCALMGAQQRITRRDVISLGTSSLFGLSLATILLLTIGAYARLSADVAAQLQGLALDGAGRRLEVERRLEVAALEQLAEPSLWDRLRVPLAVASVIAVTFLVATQREAFDATLSMAVGVSAAVPTLVKLTTLLTRLGIKGTRRPTRRQRWRQWTISPIVDGRPPLVP